MVNIDTYEITLEIYRNNKSDFYFYSFDTQSGLLLSELSNYDITRNLQNFYKSKTNIPMNNAYIYIMQDELLKRRKVKILKIKERINDRN